MTLVLTLASKMTLEVEMTSSSFVRKKLTFTCSNKAYLINVFMQVLKVLT